MADILVTIVLLLAVVLAAGSIVKAKKKGTGCCGCPNSSRCDESCHDPEK